MLEEIFKQDSKIKLLSFAKTEQFYKKYLDSMVKIASYNDGRKRTLRPTARQDMMIPGSRYAKNNDSGVKINESTSRKGSRKENPLQAQPRGTELERQTSNPQEHPRNTFAGNNNPNQSKFFNPRDSMTSNFYDLQYRVIMAGEVTTSDLGTDLELSYYNFRIRNMSDDCIKGPYSKPLSEFIQLDTEMRLWCESNIINPPKLQIAHSDSANTNISSIHQFLESCLMFGIDNWAMKKFLQELREYDQSSDTSSILDDNNNIVRSESIGPEDFYQSESGVATTLTGNQRSAISKNRGLQKASTYFVVNIKEHDLVYRSSVAALQG